MAHLIILIIQLFFISLYVFCKIFDWPGTAFFSVFGWLITVVFYLILSLKTLLQKERGRFISYFTFTLLVFCIPNKIFFEYHNIIIHFLILCAFVLILYKQKSLNYNKHYRTFIYLVLIINTILFFTSDNYIFKNIDSYYAYKPFSENGISQSDFKKVDSLNNNFDAEISSIIHYKTNKLYNYKPAVVMAEIKLDECLYVSLSNKLLEHEYYHFKITETISRRINKTLCNYHFKNASVTQKIISNYIDSLQVLQVKYDSATNHSKNQIEQKQWQIKIDRELENYIQ